MFNRLVRKVIRDAQGPWRWVDGSVPTLRLGTRYGGWYVPKSLLQPGRVAVCAGAGEDISFDVALNGSGLIVVTLDPTPRAMKHVLEVIEATHSRRSVAINNSSIDKYDLGAFSRERFVFQAVGVWSADERKRFFAPRNAGHVSHSIVNLQGTDEYIEVECRTLKTIMNDVMLDRIDILKIDVEGAEYEVLKSMFDQDIRPTAVLVEYDEGLSAHKPDARMRIRASVDGMKRAGYRLVKTENWNCVFMDAASL